MIKNNDLHNLRILTIYSTIAYLFSYLFVFLTYNIITGVVASTFNIKTILYFQKLKFITPDTSRIWNFDSALFVFGSGTLFLAILIVVLIFIYRYVEYSESFLKIFLFWLILHSINRILGAFVVGTIFHLYFSNVILYWLFVDIWVRILMSIIVIAIILWVGSMSTRPMLLSARTLNIVEIEKRYHFIVSQAIQPWLISSFILFLFHLPSYAFSENLLSITMFLLIIPSYFNNENVEIEIPVYEEENTIYKPVQNYEEDPAYRIPWKSIVFIILFMLIFRIFFFYGISF